MLSWSNNLSSLDFTCAKAGLEKNYLQNERSVLDMGSLLRTKVCFKKVDIYGEIIDKYVKIVQKYPNAVPVFDGYDDNEPSTKSITHLKRSRKVILSPTVQLDHHLPFTCDSKEAFFCK